MPSTRQAEYEAALLGLFVDAGRRLPLLDVLAVLARSHPRLSADTARLTVQRLRREGTLSNATDGWGKGYGLALWDSAERPEGEPGLTNRQAVGVVLREWRLSRRYPASRRPWQD